MALVSYASSCSSGESSDELDKTTLPRNEYCEPKQKMARLSETSSLKRNLPGATSLLGTKRTTSADIHVHQDNPAEHAGRVRGFQHERGNWATYVYISVRSEQLEDAQEACQQALTNLLDGAHTIDDLHISLSRTVVLQYHHIDSFVDSLRNALAVSPRFSISFRNLHIYTNAERTRTFIAFKVDEMYFEKMYQLMCKVDNVMTEYKLQCFYEDPSFHISFLWCLGDKVDLLNENLSILKSSISIALGESEAFSLFIQEVNCKCGNKEFTFKLK